MRIATPLIILVALFGVTIGFQARTQKPNAPTTNDPKCTLTRAHAPKLRGLALGMTHAQILARFPGARLTNFLNIHRKVGVTQVGIDFVDNPKRTNSVTRYAELTKSKFPDFKDVTNLTIYFLDKKLYDLSISYDDTIDWADTSEFVSKVSSSLALPQAWVQRDDDHEIQDLDCKEFRLVAWVRTYSKREAFLSLTDTIAEQTIDDREKNQKNTFSP